MGTWVPEGSEIDRERWLVAGRKMRRKALKRGEETGSKRTSNLLVDRPSGATERDEIRAPAIGQRHDLLAAAHRRCGRGDVAPFDEAGDQFPSTLSRDRELPPDLRDRRTTPGAHAQHASVGNDSINEAGTRHPLVKPQLVADPGTTKQWGNALGLLTDGHDPVMLPQECQPWLTEYRTPCSDVFALSSSLPLV